MICWPVSQLYWLHIAIQFFIIASPTGAEQLGSIPTHNQLLEVQVNELARIGQFDSLPSLNPQANTEHSEASTSVTKPNSQQEPSPSLALGEGLPALPKKLLERIWAQEYIDLTELPPQG